MRHLLLLMLLMPALPAWAQVSSGTAFSVAPQLMVTNQHVIDGCSAIEVIAPDGRRPATVVASEPSIDLALLRVFGLRGSTASLRTPRNIRLGESVLVYGFPLAGALSSSGNFTNGVVSALQGLRNAAGEIQITAPIQQGNSGGPVMDSSGVVIGVVQAKLDALRAVISTGDIPQNVNFAISLEVLADFLDMNKVPYRNAPRAAALDSARVAEMAQGFTYRVECRGRGQQAVAPPSIKPKPPMAVTPEANPSRSAATQTANPDWISDASTGCKVFNPRPIANETISWSGDCVNGLAQGVGVLHWYVDGKPGGTNVGKLKDGKLEGRGVYKGADGDSYEGEYRDGKRNGQGVHTWADGGRYEGEFKNANFEGRGVIKGANGNSYEGEFKDGKPNGIGVAVINGRTYSGFWVNGCFRDGTQRAYILTTAKACGM